MFRLVHRIGLVLLILISLVSILLIDADHDPFTQDYPNIDLPTAPVAVMPSDPVVDTMAVIQGAMWGSWVVLVAHRARHPWAFLRRWYRAFLGHPPV